MLKILIDSAMPYWEELFLSIAHVVTFDAGDLNVTEHTIQNSSLGSVLRETEYLLVRSTTKVNSKLLDLMPNLKFVGTATAGFDHLDIDALDDRNIKWFAAAGCNAQAVCQYMVSTILHLASVDRFNIADKTVTIVGYGQVGSRVANAMSALGASVQIYDPPLERTYIHSQANDLVSEFWQHHPLGRTAKEVLKNGNGFVDFKTALRADIICIHSPLNKFEEFYNYHLFDASVLAQLTPKQYLINAGRGEIIDNDALLQLFKMSNSNNVNVVLDVWENEPYVLNTLTPFLRIATPHIAGHSLEGKAKGTYMLYQQLCQLEKIEIKTKFDDLIPKLNTTIPEDLLARFHQSTSNVNREGTQKLQNDLLSLCNLTYFVENDDRVFRQHMAQSDSIAKLRQQYPIRREFSAIQIEALDNKTNELLRKIGFIISNDSRSSHI